MHVSRYITFANISSSSYKGFYVYTQSAYMQSGIYYVQLSLRRLVCFFPKSASCMLIGNSIQIHVNSILCKHIFCCSITKYLRWYDFLRGNPALWIVCCVPFVHFDLPLQFGNEGFQAEWANTDIFWFVTRDLSSYCAGNWTCFTYVKKKKFHFVVWTGGNVISWRVFIENWCSK